MPIPTSTTTTTTNTITTTTTTASGTASINSTGSAPRLTIVFSSLIMSIFPRPPPAASSAGGQARVVRRREPPQHFIMCIHMLRRNRQHNDDAASPMCCFPRCRVFKEALKRIDAHFSGRRPEQKKKYAMMMVIHIKRMPYEDKGRK